ncbi:hypothetical protein [Pseudofrankia sp. DC12]|uniref:hypothetical protein n=1 Tax=Pseudofrankia sp. DC12 TaxID=683315 RepID=UPI000B318167|nr:hypothetical protein [Pseudofrankia sp. DC12]
MSASHPAPSLAVTKVDWFSGLTETGGVTATKRTSPDGFRRSIDLLTNSFDATGTLTTTVNGKQYKQPANAT